MTWLYVPSLYAQELEGLTSESGLPDPTIVLWALLNDKPSARPCSWRGWKANTWIALLSGTTLQPSTAAAGVGLWISLQRGIHASPNPRRGFDAEPMTSDGCGQKFGGSFAKWDRGSSSWRTCQVTFLGRSDKFSETWPRAGGAWNGTVFQREPSAPLTNVIGFSFSPDRRTLPTPVAREIKGPTGDTHSPGLSSALGIMTRKDLNPEFVEWMMGLPSGWSEIGPTESTRSVTLSCHRRRLELGGPLRQDSSAEVTK